MHKPSPGLVQHDHAQPQANNFTIPGFDQIPKAAQISDGLLFADVPNHDRVTYTSCCRVKSPTEFSYYKNFSFGLLTSGASGNFRLCYDRGFQDFGTLAVVGPHNFHYFYCDYGVCPMVITGTRMDVLSKEFHTYSVISRPKNWTPGGKKRDIARYSECRNIPITSAGSMLKTDISTGEVFVGGSHVVGDLLVGGAAGGSNGAMGAGTPNGGGPLRETHRSA